MNLPRSSTRVALLVALLAPLGAQAVQENGFERYAIILSRMPFGEAPIEAAPPPAPKPVTTESFARAFRVCSITQSLGGDHIKVGIVDKGSNNAVFILREGEETEDGIKLVSANLADEEAVLQKGDEIALLKLGEEPVAQLDRKQLASRKPSSSQASSYADRRRERREEILERSKPKQPTERPPPIHTGPALRKHLQEYNMEAIRQGLPALPIELTPEQDLQLVKEGILEPAPGVPLPAGSQLAPELEKTRAGALIDNLPPELSNMKLEDLTTEELQLLLRSQ